jgi:hypothetical protein
MNRKTGKFLNRTEGMRITSPGREIRVPGVTGGIRARTSNGIEPGGVGEPPPSGEDRDFLS